MTRQAFYLGISWTRLASCLRIATAVLASLGFSTPFATQGIRT
jgi:hypothetical protein